MRKLIHHFIFLTFLMFSTAACANNVSEGLNSLSDAENGKNEVPGAENTEPKPGDLEICSTLDFAGVSWPSHYQFEDQRAFALALNITGSFEGHSGWTNLSNNFDGQGFSMGILNQNLGQGSIQPLLLHIRDHSPHVFEQAMTQEMMTSFLGMLTEWEASAPTATLAPLSRVDEDVEKGIVDELVLRNVLGETVDKRYYPLVVRLEPHNQKSVNWAKANLYTSSSGKDFKPEWKDALKAIAGSPEYVTLQIEAAQYLHERSHDYRQRLGWNEIRAYLFLFDIATQNGTLQEKHFDQFDAWLAKNPNATEEQQMLKMLEIRVKDSNAKWRDDVRKRKTAIIKGTGFVHGEDRNLPLEYCYDPLESYPGNTPTP
ncbi:MAG: hypothetical protein KDD33_00905 [Bdellovibrionales bacterium]|nr:hypothetical protein [Bdellovibrionales bacterium]